MVFRTHVRVAGTLICFSMALATAALAQKVDAVSPSGSVPQGFCAGGAYPGTVWPSEVRPADLILWGSFCKHGDADVGSMVSKPITAATYLSVYVAGYPGTSNVRLGIVNIKTGRQLLLHFPVSPREEWHREIFRLPVEWRGHAVQLIASDQSTESRGWLGFSEPMSSDVPPPTITASRVVWRTFLVAAILFLPSVAVCAIAASYGVDDILDTTALALITLGIVGYAAFWAYFASRTAGAIFSYATLTASLAVLLFIPITKQRRAKLATLKQLIPPGALLLFGSIFMMSLGLLHGTHDSPLLIPASRFAPPVLGADNYLPKLFADAVFQGHIPRPLHSDWLSSDRPPLQAGNSIWTYPWVSDDRDLEYLVSSVILQCSFLVGLWSLLTAFNIDWRSRGIAVFTCFFSGFTYVNTFFTWPKLYAASFLLVFAAYLLTGRFYEQRSHAGTAAVLGGLAALSMLAHGGSIFGLLGITIVAIVLRECPARTWRIAVVVAFVFYLPWMLYQKLYDPPGDRLIKWHIAGIKPPHPDSGFLDLLVANYKTLTFHDVARLKLGNLKTVMGDLPQQRKDLISMVRSAGKGDRASLDNAAVSLREQMFYYWTACVGLGVFGPLALLVGRLFRRHNQPAFLAAFRMWLCTGVTIMLWCLLMYGPDYTVAYQGCYLTVIFALAGSSLAFWAIRPHFAVLITSAEAICGAVIFIWLTPTGVGAGGPDVVDPTFTGFRGMAVACFLSAVGFVAGLVISGLLGERILPLIEKEGATV